MKGSPERAPRREGGGTLAQRAIAEILRALGSAPRAPTALESAASALVLRLALGGVRDEAAADEAACRTSLDRAARIAEERALGSPAFRSPVDPALLRTLSNDATRAALVRAIAGAPSLGALHQDLLELEVVRLDGAAVRVATGTWVMAENVLAAPPAKRSKWLQRAAGLPKATVTRYARALEAAKTAEDVLAACSPKHAADVHRGGTAFAVSRGVSRRRSGSHYTPEDIREEVVERTLAPLLDGASVASLRALSLCDPSMGAGDFLVTAARFVAERLAREARIPLPRALRDVVATSLHGVDRDPVAVDLARLALSLLADEGGGEALDLSRKLVVGDSLTGAPRSGDGPSPSRDALDFPRAFPGVFGERVGFDACVGNPPWVAYAGRAAQPLAPDLARYYERENPAFFGYRTLHGLFVRRTADLLRPGGRLGLVLPTSVADLSGYGPTRAAHDEIADADSELTDFGDGAFPGVFQPCMALTSTRRARARDREPDGAPWTLARRDLDAVGARLLARLCALQTLDPTLFGERGFQTTGDDLAHLRKATEPEGRFTIPIREGADVSEFSLGAPRHFLDANGLSGKLRSAAEFRDVKVLIRQTARYPMATLGDGVAFRNSVLAAFENAEWCAAALSAYLNSSVVRWFHFTKHRDARQGMPQLKIGHLRALPHVADVAARERLREFGERANARGPLGAEARAALDAIVADALALSGPERTLVAGFASMHPLPVPRKR